MVETLPLLLFQLSQLFTHQAGSFVMPAMREDTEHIGESFL